MSELQLGDTLEELTLKEVCERCFVNAEQVIGLVEYGVVEPRGERYSEWRFSVTGYLRIRKALRLQRDLSINEAGVALAIDLLDQLKSANEEIAYLRRRMRALGEDIEG